MYATERQQLIEHLVATEGRVVVVELARRFGVTCTGERLRVRA